jgi:hypothetical protein
VRKSRDWHAGSPLHARLRHLGFEQPRQAGPVNGAVPADITITSPTWTNGAKPTNFSWDILDANGVAN